MEDRPMESYSFGDIQATSTGFWITVALGFVLGLVVFILAVKPQARRPEYSGTEPFSVGCGLVLGSFPLLLCAGIAYYSNFSVFYQMNIGSKGVVLHYQVPHRTTSIEYADIKKIMGYKPNPKSRMYCLSISTEDESHQSATMTKDEIQKAIDLVKHHLQKSEE